MQNENSILVVIGFPDTVALNLYMSQVFMTIGDTHKYSLCLCYCQTKKLQSQGTHLMDPSTMQHKKPAMQCLVHNKSSTRGHKISVAERTS